MSNEHRRRIATTLAVLQVLMPISLPASAQTVLAFDALRVSTQRVTTQQAAYALAASISDTDADGTVEPPTMTSGSGPSGGGVVPSGYGAPTSDGYGRALGYCAWDHGSVTNSANRIAGVATSASDFGSRAILAVVTSGADNTFQTTCADLQTGGAAKGDDYAVTINYSQVRPGGSITVYWGAPVATSASLPSSASAIDGEVRLTKDNNHLWRYTSGTGWTDISSGGGGGSTATNLSGGTTGSIPYQSAADTTTFLADVATGNALISGGVGVAPAWGKVGLTTHVSGTLPVASGGTGATALTANGLLYGNGTSAVGVTAGGTSGQLLVANGSGIPTFVTLSGSGATASLSNAGVLTLSSIANSALANSSITIGSTSVSLGGTASTIAGLTLSSPTINGGILAGINSFGLRSSGTGAFDVNLANTENLTAVRTLTLKLNDANRTLNLGGDFTTSGAAITLTATGATNVTLPTSGTLATLAGTETLTNKTIGSGSTWNGNAVGVAYGGTGQSTYTVGDILYASTTSALSKLSAGTSGYVLTSNGAGVAPSWQAVTATTSSNLTGGTTGSIPYQSAANTTTFLADVATGSAMISGGVGVAPSWGKIGLTTHVSGTLPVTSGGTGLTSLTSGDILYASASNTLSALAKGTDGQVLTLASGLPSWTTLSGSVDWTQPGTIGSTTPNTGAFTTLTAQYINVTGSTKPANGLYLQAANSLGIATNSTERVRITSAGIVCVNCASSIPTGSNNPYYVTVNGNILAARFDGSSDARLKTNVSTVTNALNKVRSLRGVGFDWRQDIPGKTLPTGRDYGFIAQELEQVLPELVREDGWGYRVVNYSGVIPVLTEAIKELDTTVTQHGKIIQHFSKPDANTLALNIPVLKAQKLLAEELGVKKISTPVIETTDTFKIIDATTKTSRFEIDAAGKVRLETLAVGKDVSIGGNLTISGTQSAGAFAPTSATVPSRGLFAPSARSIGLAADNKLVAELEARGLTVYGDIYVGEAGATKKVIDKEGYLYAANEITSGAACAGRSGAIGRDGEGRLYVCR